MIGCDECEKWYHGPCVAVDKIAADSMDDYLCPKCSQKAGKPYAYVMPPPVPRRTRRPRLRYVTSLLAEAEGIGVELPEEGHIRSLHAAAEEWQRRAEDLQAHTVCVMTA